MSGTGNYERRESARIDMEKQLISISWSAEGQKYTRDVMCIDVSGGGLQIELDRPLPTGTVIQLSFQQGSDCHDLCAKVLRSVLQEHGWFTIGLMLIKDSE